MDTIDMALHTHAARKATGRLKDDEFTSHSPVRPGHDRDQFVRLE